MAGATRRALRLRRHAARHRAGRLGSFAGALGLAPLVGSEFIPRDRQQLHPAQRAPAGRHQPGARQRRSSRRSRTVLRGMPEVRLVSTTIGDTGNGSRNSAQLGIQLIKPHERRRTQKRGRGGAARGAEADPRHRGCRSATGRSTSRCSAPTRRCSRPRCGKLADKVAKVPGIADLRPRSSPACRPTRCGSSPTRCASSA